MGGGTSNDPVRQERIQIIANRERAELLLVSEVRDAKSEVIIGISSVSYLSRLAELGLIDSLEAAKNNNNVEILILCPEAGQLNLSPARAVAQSKEEEKDRGIGVLREYARYARFNEIVGMRGSVAVIDNSTLLMLSEEGVDAIAFFTHNKSIVQNTISLLDSLLAEREILESIASAKDALKEANDDLSTALQKLEEANTQLEAKSRLQQDFINLAAHELRTPVMTMMLLAEMFAEDAAVLSPQQKATPLLSTSSAQNESVSVPVEYVRMLNENVKRLETLTWNILEVSIADNGALQLEKERFNLVELLKTLAEGFSESAEKSASPVRLRTSEKIFVEADRAKLTRAFGNLLESAWKSTLTSHSKGPGEVEKKEIEVNCEDGGDNVLITISNFARKFSSEADRVHLFNRFASASSKTGMDLRMYVAMRLVEAHGGTITTLEDAFATSGTTLLVTLPKRR